jgi:two-component system, cell cycle response regulator
MDVGEFTVMPKAQRLTKAAETSPGEGSGMLRIVLVGRTGLDGRLRLDPAAELLRARTALDAVGELGVVMKQDGVLQNVALVAAESDPGEPGSRREFLDALRRVDPAIRIFWIGDASSAPVEYDGSVGADADVDEIRAVLSGREPGPETVAEMPPEAAPVVPVSEDLSCLIDTLAAGKTGAADCGDEVLVRFLIQGREITDAALDLVRQRLGGRRVALAAEDAAVEPGSGEAAVAWRGRILGRLRSPEVSSEELAQHASWLASWLVLRDQHAQLREAAFEDPLTGAYNRRYFDQFLRMAMEEARKERRGVTLLMFDIDNFKKFNDQYGHGAGDDILRETVRLLRSVIRPSDKVCRIGGDEFAVIFHEPTGPRTPSSRPPSDVCQIAARFQGEVAAQRFPKLGREAPGPLTISGGLATYPWDGATPESLLARADELAMQSKRMGKNCITFGPGAEGPRTL